LFLVYIQEENIACMCKLIEAVGKRYEERTLASAVKRKKKDAADKEKPIM